MSDGRLGTGLLALGLCLALGAMGTAAIASHGFLRAKSADRALRVKGFAERQIDSDLVRWRGAFTKRAASLEEAHAGLVRDRERTLALVHAAELPAAEIGLTAVSTHLLHGLTAKGIQTNEVEGYELRQEVVVTSRGIDAVLQLMGASDALIREGVEFQSLQPEFFYTRLGELKIDMLREATADGRRRADTLAEAGGGAIDRLVAARQGVFQITPEHSTQVSNYGHNDTTTRRKSIKAVVTLEYALGS